MAAESLVLVSSVTAGPPAAPIVRGCAEAISIAPSVIALGSAIVRGALRLLRNRARTPGPLGTAGMEPVGSSITLPAGAAQLAALFQAPSESAYHVAVGGALPNSMSVGAMSLGPLRLEARNSKKPCTRTGVPMGTVPAPR